MPAPIHSPLITEQATVRQSHCYCHPLFVGMVLLLEHVMRNCYGSPELPLKAMLLRRWHSDLKNSPVPEAYRTVFAMQEYDPTIDRCWLQKQLNSGPESLIHGHLI